MIDVQDIIKLGDLHLKKWEKRYNELKKENEKLIAQVEANKSSLHKISFHIDKTSKLIDIIKMDNDSEKPFNEIHPNIDMRHKELEQE